MSDKQAVPVALLERDDETDKHVLVGFLRCDASAKATEIKLPDGLGGEFNRLWLICYAGWRAIELNVEDDAPGLDELRRAGLVVELRDVLRDYAAAATDDATLSHIETRGQALDRLYGAAIRFGCPA